MQQIGKYEVERELARGGMGVVYVARHLQLGRRVALKLLTSPLNKRTLDRFRVEAQAVAQLDHPHIVKIHEVDIDTNGRPYLTMELVEGEPLSDLIDQGPLDPRQAAVLVEALARAVEHAHQRGILHRDLKPSNVLLTPDGQPLLTDFGLARELCDERERLTRTGEVLGTPGYMPPEQADGRVSDVGPGSDVYGLGATLFSLLCGRPPFLGAAIPAIIAQVLYQSPPSPRALRPEIAPDLAGICLRALEKEPRDRYPSAAAMADDLLRYLRGEPVTQPRRRGAWKVPALALAGVLAIAGLVAVLSSTTPTPAAPPAPTRSASTSSPTPTPAPSTAAPAPFVAPTRLRLDWRARPPLAKPGEWFGGFLPNGHAIAWRRGDARAWRITGPGAFEPFDLPGASRAFTIAGRGVIVVVGREVLALDPPRARRLLHTLDPGWKTLDQLEVAPDGRTLAFAGRHGAAVRVTVLDADRPETPPRQGAVRTETRPVTCLALADDLVIGAGGFDVRKLGEGVVYRAPLSRYPDGRWESWSPQTGYPTAIAIAPDGLLAIGSSGGQAYLFRDGLKKRPTPLKGKAGILGFAHQGAVRGLVFSADGARLYTAAGELNKKEGELAVWALDPSGPRVIEKRKELGRAVRELHLSPDQRRLLVLTQQGPELWSVPKP